MTRCHTSEDQTSEVLLHNHMFGPGEIWLPAETTQLCASNFERDVEAKLPISFQQAELHVYEGQYFSNENYCN
jgi:hypothetical protein